MMIIKKRSLSHQSLYIFGSSKIPGRILCAVSEWFEMFSLC